MERQNELQKLTDDYLLDRLSPEQESQLQRERDENPDFSQDLAAATEATAAIDLFADMEIKNRLQKVEDSMRTSGQTAKPGGAKVIGFPPRKWYAAAAAVLVLLAAGWFLLRNDSTATLGGPEQFAANFEPYRNVAVALTRGVEEPSPEEVAYTAYEAGDWSTAATALAALPANPVNQFYRAQVALAEKQFDRAAEWLAPVAEAAGPLRPAAEWYLALAELGRENQSVATDMLERIAGTEGHPFAAEANKILNE